VSESAQDQSAREQSAQINRPAVLHVCKREMLRPLRDQILRVSGYDVDSTLSIAEARSMFSSRSYHLVLIDVEGEHGIPEAEQLCSEIKKARHEQLIAFVCNWRVAVLTDCPDDVVRTEFDPAAFVKGVRELIEKS
jgi:DNA-binding response OmpR family regulator